MRFSFLLIATAIVLVGGAPARSQETTISFGSATANLGGKVVELPAPDGYEEVTQNWESMKTAFTASVPPQGDLLAAYMTVSDCELLRKGQPPLMPSWTMINIYREARTHVSDRAEFARIVALARQSRENIFDPQALKKEYARISDFLSNVTSKNMKLDLSKPKILAEFDSRPNVYSSLLLLKMRVQEDAKEATQPPVLGTMSFVLIKQRIITVLSYKKLESKEDAKTLTKLTTKWINEILAAN